MREMLQEGWKPRRVVIGALCGLVLAVGAILLTGPDAAVVVFAVFLLAFLALGAFYLWSLWYLRFTQKGRVAWAEHQRRLEEQ